MMPGRVSCVFHIHTRHSFDCIASPAKAVEWAQRHHIDVLAITDHNTIRGAQEAARIATSRGVQVIIGAEYATNHGDIIGLFLKEEVHTRDAFEVIEAVKGQGGISVLPHPYHGHRSIDKLAQAVDVVEVFNARCSDDQNQRAFDLAKAQNKPIIAGADAHFIGELGNCVSYLEAECGITPDTVLSGERSWVGNPSRKTGLYWSQVIKGLKTHDPALVRSFLRALLLTYLRSATGERGYNAIHRASKRAGMI